jgi:hypothetical protein
VPGELMDIKKTLNGEPPQRNSLAANGKPDYKNNSEYKRSLNAFLRTKAEYEKDYAGKSDDEIKEMITDKIETYYEVPEDEICNLEFNGSQGMLPVLIMPVLLNMLNYSYRVYTTVSEPDNVETSVKKRVIDKMDLLENQACLGALINVGGTHWTAIVKYRKNCMEQSKQNGVQLYAYADSLVCGIKELDICYLLEDLKVYMTKKVDIQGAVFIFAKEDSYMSKAVQNKINGLGNRGTQRNVLGRKKWSKTMKR